MLEEQLHHLLKSCEQRTVPTVSGCLNVLQESLSIVDMVKLILVQKIDWESTEKQQIVISHHRECEHFASSLSEAKLKSGKGE